MLSWPSNTWMTRKSVEWAAEHYFRHGVELLLMFKSPRVAKVAGAIGVVLAVLCALGCGENAEGDSSQADSCTSYVPQASPDDIAKTPRPDSSAELLALETSAALVAPSPLYDRIASDLGAIVAGDATVMVIKPIFPGLLVGLTVKFEEAVRADVESGNYHAWGCANQAYGASIEELPYWTGRRLTFGEKRFSAALLATEYSALPDVADVGYQEIVSDGPDVCLEVAGDQHYYIFDQASGDCPSGCMEHRYIGFQVGPSGVVAALGDYDPKKMAVEPDWFKARTDCRSRL